MTALLGPEIALVVGLVAILVADLFPSPAARQS